MTLAPFSLGAKKHNRYSPDSVLTGAGPLVETRRDELIDYLPDYELIHACINGQRMVKAHGDTYLPRPNPHDKGDENLARYNSYLKRALFYNVAQRTLSGFVGEVFGTDPVCELPPGLEILKENADNAGLTLTQFAKRAARYTLAMGRAGIFADYPAVNDASRADIESGRVRPFLKIYDVAEIINWRTETLGAKTYLNLVVLEELYDTQDDGFIVNRKLQYRVLRLNNGVYTVTLYRDGKPVTDEIMPTDAQGNPFTEIPFTFIGSENNDSEIDHPPMLDLCEINIAHYRNSADYEESIYMAGQPTPVISGLTEEWAKDVLNDKIVLGIRGGLMLPENGDAQLLVMESNTAAYESMTHKEEQMVRLGARLIEENEVERTATEVVIENNSETSVLADVARNVSAAIKYALEICGRFTGDNVAELKYELNTDFKIARMTAQDRQQLLMEWQAGAVSYTELRQNLHQSGVARQDDAVAKAEAEADTLRTEGQQAEGNQGKGVDN